MGDRANICIVQNHRSDKKECLFLYTHWGGYSLPAILQSALIKAQGKDQKFPDNRWDDEPYLARIIFQEMIGDDRGIQGYGISTYLGDNERPILVVDAATQSVGMANEEGVPIDGGPPPVDEKWSFAEYIALTQLPWGNEEDE